MTTKPKADDRTGWGVVRPLDKGAHYYRANGNSLCSQVGLYTGPISSHQPSQACAGCAAKLARMEKTPSLTSSEATPARKTRATKTPGKSRKRA